MRVPLPPPARARLDSAKNRRVPRFAPPSLYIQARNTRSSDANLGFGGGLTFAPFVKVGTANLKSTGRTERTASASRFGTASRFFSTILFTSLIDINDNNYIANNSKMSFPIHNPFVAKILPVTLLDPKILTSVLRQSSDSKRSGGGGTRIKVVRTGSIPDKIDRADS